MSYKVFDLENETHKIYDCKEFCKLIGISERTFTNRWRLKTTIGLTMKNKWYIKELEAEVNPSIKKSKPIPKPKPEKKNIVSGGDYNDADYVDIKKEFKNISLFRKIEQNLYQSDKYFKVSIYSQKKINERYFVSEQDARKCLEYFRNAK